MPTLRQQKLVRINKLLAQSTNFSRREIDKLIDEQRVVVDNELVTKQGIQVSINSIVKIDNKPINLKSDQQLNDVYISDTIGLQIEQHDLLVLNKTDLLVESELSKCIDTLLKHFEIRKFLKTVNAHIEEKDMLLDFAPGEKDKSDKIKLEKKQAHEFISSTIKPTGKINADALSTLLQDPIYNIERAKGFFKNKKGEMCTIQYDGLTLEIKKAENEKDPVFVVIGKKNFYNEKEFVEKLNTIQTK